MCMCVHTGARQRRNSALLWRRIMSSRSCVGKIASPRSTPREYAEGVYRAIPRFHRAGNISFHDEHVALACASFFFFSFSKKRAGKSSRRRGRDRRKNRWRSFSLSFSLGYTLRLQSAIHASFFASNWILQRRAFPFSISRKEKLADLSEMKETRERRSLRSRRLRRGGTGGGWGFGTIAWRRRE